MPTMKASLQFKDEKGEHGGRAASGGSGGTRQQPGDAKKPEKEGGESERKSPARPSGGASGGEPEASNSLRDEAGSIGASEKDLADSRPQIWGWEPYWEPERCQAPSRWRWSSRIVGGLGRK